MSEDAIEQSDERSHAEQSVSVAPDKPESLGNVCPIALRRDRMARGCTE
jgi:hypothetical protein